jgi:hypothetical protein
MMKALRKLAELGGSPLASTPPDIALAKQGERHRELFELLTMRNGFFCFDAALHVFPSGGGDMPLERWNSSTLWRDAYGDMADEYWFFAEDVFGNQFGIAEDKVVSFDAETAEVEQVADTVEEWASKILEDYDYLTGHSLGYAWQDNYGRLPVGRRLAPKRPFVAGGEFEVDNLYALDAVKAMRWRGDLARQIRDLPDGAPIEFKVVS